ncbi:hypothetical protein ABPG74_013506 [Tetrahymena malaccensis]
MNEQFYDTSHILSQGRDKHYSMQSQEYSVQTKTTIPLQENQKQSVQSLQKTASLRSINFDGIQHRGRESAITIISTVREKKLHQQEQDYHLNSNLLNEQPQVNCLQFQKIIDDQQYQKASIATYKYIYQSKQNQILEKLPQSEQINQTQAEILNLDPQEREQQLIELRQQLFEYNQIITNPHLFHLKNLTREEFIYHLLSKNSFEHPFSNFLLQNTHLQQLSKEQNPFLYNAKRSQNVNSSFTISGPNNNSFFSEKTLNRNITYVNQIKKTNELIAQSKMQYLLREQKMLNQPLQKNNYEKQSMKNTVQELDNLQIVELYLNGQSNLQLEQIKNWVEDFINQKQPHDNYIHKFIFHKKYKDFESEEQKYQGVSRFHNLNRMFMHNIIKILSKENLQQFCLPLTVANKILIIINGIKNEAFKKYNNGKSKTCFFNHYHYNLLFLQINKETLKLFQKNSKDLEMHQSIFGVNLESEMLSCSDVIYCNLIKFYIYRIVNTTILYNIQSNDYNNCVRLQYVQRVLHGIKKLSEGQAIKRF